jgi:molybdenum cofactor synthesis domain-containing protein
MAPLPYRVVVLTISDSSAAGQREDTSGPALKDILTEEGFKVIGREVVPDDLQAIVSALLRLAEACDLIITTGGTGLGPRDVTPEATLSVCERLVPGIAELIRAEGQKQTRYAALGRGVCGAKGDTLILNLPGNPAGAVDALGTALPLIPHALELLRGHTQHGSVSVQ